MSKNNDLQDLYLSRARRSQEPVTMFLIYKHAISTIVANHAIDLTPDT